MATQCCRGQNGQLTLERPRCKTRGCHQHQDVGDLVQKQFERSCDETNVSITEKIKVIIGDSYLDPTNLNKKGFKRSSIRTRRCFCSKQYVQHETEHKSFLFWSCEDFEQKLNATKSRIDKVLESVQVSSMGTSRRAHRCYWQAGEGLARCQRGKDAVAVKSIASRLTIEERIPRLSLGHTSVRRHVWVHRGGHPPECSKSRILFKIWSIVTSHRRLCLGEKRLAEERIEREHKSSIAKNVLQTSWRADPSEGISKTMKISKLGACTTCNKPFLSWGGHQKHLAGHRGRVKSLKEATGAVPVFKSSSVRVCWLGQTDQQSSGKSSGRKVFLEHSSPQ